MSEKCVFAMEIMWVKRAWQDNTQLIRKTVSANTIFAVIFQVLVSGFCVSSDIQCDSFGTRPKKMRISQRLFIRF